MIGRKRRRALWSPTAAATGWGESTLAELSWGRSRGAATRWAVGGALLGALAALVMFAPAAWLAGLVADATGGRVLLADARGTVWSGSAIAVLTAGPGSRDASSLPGRLEWTLAPHGLALELRARQACCLNGEVVLQVRPRLGRTTLSLLPTPGWLAQWPTALLAGMGTPWNTMQLGGTARLSSRGLEIESAQGRWRLEGGAALELVGVSSRLTTLDTLGSYRMTLAGDPAHPGTALVALSTLQGALQLNGSGTWGSGGLRFRGEAHADALNEQALSNLLNIIGRRNGARSVISIG